MHRQWTRPAAAQRPLHTILAAAHSSCGRWRGERLRDRLYKLGAVAKTLVRASLPPPGTNIVSLSRHGDREQYVLNASKRALLTLNLHMVPGETDESVLRRAPERTTTVDSAAFDFCIPALGGAFRAYAAATDNGPHAGYTGFGDANLFACRLGLLTVHFGRRGVNFYQSDEWSGIPTIVGTVRILLRLALALLR